MKQKVVLAIGIFMAVAIIISSCQSESDLNFKRYYTAGLAVYQTHCQNCHGANGEGLGALMPPLNDSVYLKNNLHNLSCSIKTGKQGGITINRKTYNQQMPAQSDLTPMEIAQVLTYINNSYGNKLGLLDDQQVEADLKRCNF
ncbi:c-type cytochrome [Mucilaginibacter paludis]|uniref:Cytochrome c domain-containing protein n=1 Tax=Mucilaginibacter paludis DSM 18603 TaxID=714943 RepID=H1Y3D1_9SPHI|nr:cytochrome c [Mucilaginibacter paludis]EHQ29286.1 hypothetical protein Mucpa_5211 [Mucilaginibacter paludis DSM 18603]